MPPASNERSQPVREAGFNANRRRMDRAGPRGRKTKRQRPGLRPPQSAASFITGYSNATPSASCSANQAPNRSIACRCRGYALIDGCRYSILRLGSHFSRGLQRPAKEWVFGLLRQANQLIAVGAVDLKPVSTSAGLLAKDTRAAGTPDFDFVVYDHCRTLRKDGLCLHAVITKALKQKDRPKAVSLCSRSGLVMRLRERRFVDDVP